MAPPKIFNVPRELVNINALTNNYYNYEKIESMANWILDKFGGERPSIAIICGSGLGQICNHVKNAKVISYSEIPDFPQSTVEGHSGNLIFGELNGASVVCMQGRLHPFEGYSVALCAMPVKIFKLLGVKTVIITNAAGGINTGYKTGDLMLLKDHVSLPILSLEHPLVGQNDPRFGPRFFPINHIYNKKLRDLFKDVAKDCNIPIQEGIYSNIGGPTYETVSDLKLLKLMNVDAVGMSTIHEAIVAGYCGMKVLALSVITDMVDYDFDAEYTADHIEICKIANAACQRTETLMTEFIKRLITSDQSL